MTEYKEKATTKERIAFSNKWKKENCYEQRDYVKKKKATWQRENNKKPLSKIRNKAKSLFRTYKNKHNIKAKPCFLCKRKDRAVAHHNDYSKPYEVIWLCIWCHTKIHKIIKEFKPLGGTND